MITFRTMNIEDYKEISRLWKSCDSISFSESDTFEKIKEYLNQNPECSFVACDNNCIIGTILSGDDSRRAFINHLYVDPRYRNRGIGAHLRKLSEEALSHKNATKCYVFVKSDNINSINFKAFSNSGDAKIPRNGKSIKNLMK